MNDRLYSRQYLSNDELRATLIQGPTVGEVLRFAVKSLAYMIVLWLFVCAVCLL